MRASFFLLFLRRRGNAVWRRGRAAVAAEVAELTTPKQLRGKTPRASKVKPPKKEEEERILLVCFKGGIKEKRKKKEKVYFSTSVATDAHEHIHQPMHHQTIVVQINLQPIKEKERRQTKWEEKNGEGEETERTGRGESGYVLVVFFFFEKFFFFLLLNL